MSLSRNAIGREFQRDGTTVLVKRLAGKSVSADIFYVEYKKGKVRPYSLSSVGPGADPGVKAVSQQATLSHPPGGRLSLLSVWPAVTLPSQSTSPPIGQYEIILFGDRGTWV